MSCTFVLLFCAAISAECRHIYYRISNSSNTIRLHWLLFRLALLFLLFHHVNSYSNCLNFSDLLSQYVPWWNDARAHTHFVAFTVICFSICFQHALITILAIWLSTMAIVILFNTWFEHHTKESTQLSNVYFQFVHSSSTHIFTVEENAFRKKEKMTVL